ncbi:MAG: 2OG-Fe(II) oxygenase [Pseudomonadota bacterium]
MAKVTLEELRDIAAAGDARAQYALAGLLSMRGEAAEANKWLEAAAAQEEPDALYTMATRTFFTRETIAEALPQLEKSAANGSTAGARLMAALKVEGAHTSADWKGAIDLVIGAAKAGDAAAKREIAMTLFASDPGDKDGAVLLHEAAKADAAAAAITVCRLIEGRAYTNHGEADAALQRLEAARYPNAAALRAAFPDAPSSADDAPAAVDWVAVKARLAEPPQSGIAPLEQALQTPDVRQARGAFTREECEYLIAASVRLLAPSMIVDPATGQSRADPHRTSLTAILGPVDYELTLVRLSQRIAQYADQSEETGEFLSVLRYASGQEYRPHFDWLPEGSEHARSGQRVATALVYLNDDYEGGETHFLTPDTKLRPAAGDLILFRNVDETGAPDQTSRHAGLPVTAGAKWLASKWFRERMYEF